MGRPRITPLSSGRLSPDTASRRAASLIAFNSPDTQASSRPFIIPVGAPLIMEVDVGETGTIRVENCSGGTVSCVDSFVAVAFDPAQPYAHGGVVKVTSDPQTFSIRALHPGTSYIEATSKTTGGLFLESRDFLSLAVRSSTATQFTPGVAHNHTATGQWAKVQANPGEDISSASSIYLAHMCPVSSPRQLVNLAIDHAFGDKPNALKHLKWYLGGRGAEFVEDAYIADWLKRDKGIRHRIKNEIYDSSEKPRMRGSFTFDQSEYHIEDYQYSFGGIDRIDFKVDLADGPCMSGFRTGMSGILFIPAFTAVSVMMKCGSPIACMPRWLNSRRMERRIFG